MADLRPPIPRVSANDIAAAGFDEIIDVRSPAEFAEDALPGAINLPVLDDAQRIEVGTLYKQTGPFEAKRLGAGLVSANIATHLAGPLAERPKGFAPLLYCWRGGERSGSMATVLRAVGWKVSLLEGGYRAYRKFVVESLQALTESDLKFEIIAGLTGSGKTRLLHLLAERGAQVLDLEGLAEHRGSALGESLTTPQPSQKRFEQLLFESLRHCDPGRPVYVESESSRIGRVQVPAALWARLRDSPLIELQASASHRAAFLVEAYDHFVQDRALLAEKLELLRPLKPAALMARWEADIEAGRWQDFVVSMLEDHYDAAYLRSREKIYGSGARPLPLDAVDEKALGRAVDRILSEKWD